MTNESNQARTPAGVPTGGQFAASAKSESDVALGGNAQADANAALIAEYLGDGPDLTADQQRLLDILVADDVNSFVGAPARLDEVLDDLEAAGDDTSFRGAEMVAERLYADYEMDLSQSETGAGGFSFRLNRTEDGVGSYAVGAYLGNVENVWLSEAHDSKRLSVHRDFPEGTSGLRKAVAIAEVIDDDFRRLRAKGARLGLMPDLDPTPGTTRGTCGACGRTVVKKGDSWLDENGGHCMPRGGALMRHSNILPA